MNKATEGLNFYFSSALPPKICYLRQILYSSKLRCDLKKFKMSPETPSILTREQEKNPYVFDLRILNASIMVRVLPPLLPRNSAAFGSFLKKIQCRKILFYFGRGRDIVRKSVKNEAASLFASFFHLCTLTCIMMVPMVTPVLLTLQSIDKKFNFFKCRRKLLFSTRSKMQEKPLKKNKNRVTLSIFRSSGNVKNFGIFDHLSSHRKMH